MNSELLSLRLEVLEHGISDVQTVLSASQEITTALRNAKTRAQRAGIFIGSIEVGLANETIRSSIGELKHFIEDIDSRPDVLNYLEHRRITVESGTWVEALSSIARELERCQETGRELSSQFKQLAGELSRVEKRVVKFDEEFQRRVGGTIKESTDEIHNLQRSLRGEKPPVENPWDNYFTVIEPKAQRVFVEYLDLLGGVSIRERGLAQTALTQECHLDDLCALADLHLTSELTLCVNLETEVTAVPGSGATGDVPRWPILRLGLASWSIWGLPLTGHEFGKLVADERLSKEAAAREWQHELSMFGKKDLRMLIADTIGAWAEGPAYACALLFLMLNPTAGHDKANPGAITDAERAQVVLTVLDQQAGRDTDGERRQAYGYNYEPFLNLLRSVWDSGRSQTGAGTVDGKAADGHNGATEREKLLAKLPQLIIERFDLKKPFGLDDWELSLKVLKHLTSDANPLPDELPTGVRHLTNAAWRGRLRAEPEVEPVEPEELARRAMGEGLNLVNPKRKQPSTVATDVLKGGSAGP